MTSDRRFDGLADPFVPTRAWAAAFVGGYPDYWSGVLEDYRTRISDFHAELAQDMPASFPMQGPAQTIVVVSLCRSWTFVKAHPDATAGQSDELVIDERWEDPILSRTAILHAPDDGEAQVRQVAALDSEYTLIQKMNLGEMYRMHGSDPWQNGLRRLPGPFNVGWRLADGHAGHAKLTISLNEALGRGLDQPRLRTLTNDLQTMRSDTNAQRRGLAFEALMENMFAAHGCSVERGRNRPGEQVDLFVHRPFRALVECKWLNEPVGTPAVALLVAKLTRDRPAIVAGLHISMSGYTQEAQEEARAHARERVVVLLDASDVGQLLNGSTHIADLFDERVDVLVRRY